MGEIEAGLSYLRGKSISQSQLIARGVPRLQVRAVQTWLKNYKQNSDDDFAFMDALENEFGNDVFEWVNGIWLDEVANDPGKFQPVIKAVEIKKKRKRKSPRKKLKRKLAGKTGATNKKLKRMFPLKANKKIKTKSRLNKKVIKRKNNNSSNSNFRM